MIDVVGQPRIQVSQRVVGQRRQVYDGLKSIQIPRGEITQIFADLGNVGDSLTEVTAGEKAGIETDYVVPRGLQHRSSHCADITLMTC